MKKILFLASLVTLLMTSCGDSFFDLEPASKVTIDKVYKTASDYNVAVVGCYAKLQSQVNFYKSDIFFYFIERNHLRLHMKLILIFTVINLRRSLCQNQDWFSINHK